MYGLLAALVAFLVVFVLAHYAFGVGAVLSAVLGLIGAVLALVTVRHRYRE